MAMKGLALCIAAVGIHFPVLAFNSTCYMPPYQGGGTEGHVASGDTRCSPSTDDDVARACCGYSDGSICLSNGLCFVPSNNSMLQGSCTDPSWTSPGCPNTKCVGMRAVLYISRWDTNQGSDANLQLCQSAPENVPAPGDSGGLWFCRTSSRSCADAVSTFGIQQGHFADFRNPGQRRIQKVLERSGTLAVAVSEERVCHQLGKKGSARERNREVLLG